MDCILSWFRRVGCEGGESIRLTQSGFCLSTKSASRVDFTGSRGNDASNRQAHSSFVCCRKEWSCDKQLERETSLQTPLFRTWPVRFVPSPCKAVKKSLLALWFSLL